MTLYPSPSALSCVLGLLCVAAQAQTDTASPAPIELDRVTVELKRDTRLLPYAQINKYLLGLQEHGQGLFRLEFKLSAKDPNQTLPKPRMAVQSERQQLPVVVDAQGRFNLPTLPMEEGKDADLATNLPKGSATVRGTMRLTVPPPQLDMATVRRIVSVANRVRVELLPWYARWIFPQIEGVRVCSGQAQWSLEWPDKSVEKGQVLTVPLSADPNDRDPDAEPEHQAQVCTTLTGKEAWPDAARLSAPADTRLSVRLLKT